MHQTQFSEKIPYGGFSQIRSQIFCAINIFRIYLNNFLINDSSAHNIHAFNFRISQAVRNNKIFAIYGTLFASPNSSAGLIVKFLMAFQTHYIVATYDFTT